ncbi:hypothetical protein [Rahnella sp. CFA14(1/10)]|uniref:hypothetical protein n=1 Tax=Rahnella sp. CFA14(1/10) TaxID=2511203 RepID=UPI00102287BA|nr:hypothetical protein [Rahnella sp. CFA14(1/10)]
MVNYFRVAATALAAGFIALMIFLAFHFYGQSVEAKGQVNKLQSDNALQSETISTQAFNFQRSNQIAGAAQLYAVQIVGKSQEREIEYRTIIKRDPASSKCVDSAVADRLLEYTNSLRASAMHTDTGQPAAESTPTASTGCRLTYGQAVYWIDPLLTTIDQLNNQLDGIKQADEARQK